MIWLLLAFLILLLVFVYVFLPLLKPTQNLSAQPSINDLLTEKRGVLIAQLRELQLDYDLGKLSVADYEAALTQKQAALSQCLQALEQQSPST